MSLAGFYARTRSGQVIHTTTMEALSRIASFPDLDFEPGGVANLVVPNASSVSVSAGGIATVQFLGLGRTPDYLVTLNPLHPDDSTMLVTHVDGTRAWYRLRLHERGVQQDNWVVAYAHEIAEQWKVLRDPVDLIAAEESL